MRNNSPRNIALAVLLVLAVVAVAYRIAYPGKEKVVPNTMGGGVYYTGPMVNKSGTAITKEDGTIVQKLGDGKKKAGPPGAP